MVFIGDAPPPFSEKKSMLSLAKQAHREGGYVIHAISMRRWDGWEGVPYFPELATAGSGHAFAMEGERLFESVFRTLMMAASDTDLERVLLVVKELANTIPAKTSSARG